MCLLILFTGCGHREVMVDSGTYEGTILKINAAETEIYVALDESRVIELYFTESTSITRGQNEAAFKDLIKGQSVRVEVKRTEKGMIPLHVSILEP